MNYQNILLIDDDHDDHEIFKNALEKISTDINCVSLTSAKDALARLNGKELNPEIIFLDLNMPIMTGQEFLKEIKNSGELKQIPVIIFSTSSNPSTIAATRQLGASQFITKPDTLSQLVEILKPIFIFS